MILILSVQNNNLYVPRFPLMFHKNNILLMRIRRPKGQRKTTCSKCGNELTKNRIGVHNYCNPCHAAHMREHRPKYSEQSEESRRKEIARCYANVYFRRGKLIKKPCVDCGSQQSQMHHEDYSKPIEIIWLCRICHLKRHKTVFMKQ